MSAYLKLKAGIFKKNIKPALSDLQSESLNTNGNN